MKKKQIFIAFVVLAVVVTSIVLISMYYPCYDTVVKGDKYKISQTVHDDPFELRIDPKVYLPLGSGKQVMVNQVLYQGENTKIILKKVYRLDDEYTFLVDTEVDWKFSGTFLTSRAISNENGKRSIKTGSFYCEGFNEKGETLRIMLSHAYDEPLGFIVTDDIMNNENEIIIKINKYNLTKYSLF